MVARCLPVFKVSASLITPPPFLRRPAWVLFSSAPAPPAHPHRSPASLFIFGQSVTQLRFLRGVWTVCPDWIHTGQMAYHLSEVTVT